MFCIGAAPTVPGIAARFSRPANPRASDQCTKSFQFSPAATRTRARSSSASRMWMPRVAIDSTTPGQSRVNSMLLPSPSTSSGCDFSAAKPNSSASASLLAHVDQHRGARRDAKRVAACERGVLDDGVAGALGDRGDSCAARRRRCARGSLRRIRRSARVRDRPCPCRTARATRRRRFSPPHRRRQRCRRRRPAEHGRRGVCVMPRSTAVDFSNSGLPERPPLSSAWRSRRPVRDRWSCSCRSGRRCRWRARPRRCRRAPPRQDPARSSAASACARRASEARRSCASRSVPTKRFSVSSSCRSRRPCVFGEEMLIVT